MEHALLQTLCGVAVGVDVPEIVNSNWHKLVRGTEVGVGDDVVVAVAVGVGLDVGVALEVGVGDGLAVGEGDGDSIVTTPSSSQSELPTTFQLKEEELGTFTSPMVTAEVFLVSLGTLNVPTFASSINTSAV